MFHVGQKVVCVEAGGAYGHGKKPSPHRLVAGAVYTVRGCGFSPQFGEEDIPMLWLEGVVRYNIFDEDVGYAACRFRPVVERKTDISIFTEMLTPKTEQVPA